MANLATSLLDFILDLLRDPETAAEFQADPQGTLAAAGLDDVCPADIQNAKLVLDEMPPSGVTPVGVAGVAAPAAAGTAPVLATTTQVSPASAPDDTDSVVEQLRYIQQTFTYNSETNIDARDSVWAGKDVYQIFGDDAVVATGDGIAAGDDVDDVAIDRSVEIEDSFNIDDSFNPENSGNTQTGTGNVNGHGADVELDNSGNEVEDSNGVVIGGGEIENATSGNGNVVGNELEVEDSFNDNSTTNTSTTTNTDNSSDDDGSYHDTDIDNSSDDDVDVDVEFDDAVLGNNSAGDTVDQSVTDSGNTDIADSGNGSAVDLGPGSAVAVDDVEVDVTL